jgi:hypothetical protein
LNSIRVSKSWIEDEERRDNDQPRGVQHRELHSTRRGEDRGEADEAARRLQDRQAGLDSDLGDPARLQELVGREPGAGGLQAEAGEGVEDDLGEAVADQESEEAECRASS